MEINLFRKVVVRCWVSKNVIQLCVSKKVAYTLVKSGQFAYVRAGRAIRVSKDSFDKWLNQN